ncbi:MAG TPA: hypothetical protein VMV18_01820, partial [bacterium]|nr:hypothetical protein [bacterium]
GVKSDKPLLKIPLAAGEHVLHVQNDALNVALACAFTVEAGRVREPVTLKLSEKQTACPNLESGPSNAVP